MDRDTLTGLMRDAAPLLDADRLAQLDDGNWYLTIGDLAIDVELDETVPRIVVSGDVGPLPEGVEPRRLEILLAYNALWTQHGGLRTALDLQSRQVVLMLDVPLQFLDLQSLATVLGGFRAAMEDWSKLLAAPHSGQGASEDPLSPMLNFGLRA